MSDLATNLRRTDLRIQGIEGEHVVRLSDGEDGAPFFRGMLVALALAIPFWTIVAVIIRALVTP